MNIRIIYRFLSGSRDFTGTDKGKITFDSAANLPRRNIQSNKLYRKQCAPNLLSLSAKYEPRTLTKLRSIKVQPVTRCFSPIHTKDSEGHLLRLLLFGRNLNRAIKVTLDTSDDIKTPYSSDSFFYETWIAHCKHVLTIFVGPFVRFRQTITQIHEIRGPPFIC